MKRTLKWIGLTVGALVLLIVIAAVALPFVIDPNDFRDDISDAVRDATGRELSIDADLELTVFPWLGLKTGVVKLANAPGFDGRPFASVESAHVSVRLLPLLRGTVEADTVTLRGLTLHLVRRADGTNNWQDLVAGEAAEPAGDGTAAAADETALPAIDVGGVELREGRVTWRDDVGDTELDVRNLRLSTGRLRPGNPLDVSFGFRLDGKRPALLADVGFSGTVIADPEGPVLAVDNGRLTIGATGDLIPLDKLDLEAGWNRMRADLGRDTAEVAGLTVTANRVQATIEAAVEKLTGEPALQASLTIPAFDTAPVLKAFGKQLPKQVAWHALGKVGFRGSVAVDTRRSRLETTDLRMTLLGGTLSGSATLEPYAPEAKGNGRLELEGLSAGQLQKLIAPAIGETLSVAGLGTLSASGDWTIDMAGHRAALRDLTVAAGPVRLQASVDATGLGGDVAASGRVSVAELSPRQLLNVLKLEALPATRDDKAFTRASLETRFDASPSSLSLKELSARLDETTVTGAIDVRRFEGPSAAWNLTVDAVNADRYLPPPEGAPSGGGKQNAADDINRIELPVEPLRGPDLDGMLRIGRITVAGMTASDVRVGLDSGNGKYRLEPLAAKLYQGRLEGRLEYDVGGKQPGGAVDARLNGVQFEPLLRDLFEEERISGRADVDANLSGRGRTVGAMRRSLAGNLGFDIRDGAYHGFNLWHEIERAYALLKKRTPPTTDSPDTTKFGYLKGSGKVRKGVWKNEDLVAELPFISATGRGTVDLHDETLDYRLEAVVRDRPGIERGEAMAGLKGESIPIAITGPLADPKVRPKVGRVLERKAKEKAKEKLEEEKQEAEDKLKDKLKDIFR